MTYQGARAQPLDSEAKRVFSVSKIHLDAAGWATHVLWSEVNAKSNADVSAHVVVPVADVVDALHDGAQVAAVLLPPHTHLPQQLLEVIAHDDGSETIGLVRPLEGGAEPLFVMKDIAALEIDAPTVSASGPEPVLAYAQTAHAGSAKTFAVSQVKLDEDGRVTDVLWGRVDTALNTWAEPEVEAPVLQVVAALQEGGRVFALFPSTHGHVRDRQFVQADYDGERQTIVLLGPNALDRNIHDMDRIVVSGAHRPKATVMQ
jgi:hypothetical protein